YFKRLNPFMQPTKEDKQRTWNIWIKVIVGVIAVGIIGLLFDDLVDSYFFNWQTVSIALIVYGVAFIIIERRNKARTMPIKSWDNFSFMKAFQVGLFQIFSFLYATFRFVLYIVGVM